MNILRDKRAWFGAAWLVLIAMIFTGIPQQAVTNIFCPSNNTLTCTVTGLWNFTGGLEVNGLDISGSGSGYISVTGFGAKGDGQVGIGNVLVGALNQIQVTTGTPATTDAGKTLYISEAPYGPAVLPNGNACTNGGANGFVACGGTGTLGNTTDAHVYYQIVETGTNGTGQVSIEGAILIPAGNAGVAGVNVPSPTAVNGATHWKLYASIDPAIDGDHAAGLMSGTEVLQTQCGSSGSINISTACELDTITTGTAQPPVTTMLATTILSVSGTTITLAASLPKPVNGNQFSWGTPDDAAFASAWAVASTVRGGCLLVPPSPTGGFYYITTGIVTSSHYFCMEGAGPANGVIQSYANVQQGIPYTAGGTSEIGTPANIAIVSITSPTTPKQMHQGPKIENLVFSDVSGPACNAKGAIYMEDINHFTYRDNSFNFFCKPGTSALSGEDGGGEGGGYAIACNVNDLGVLDQCQYGLVENNSGFYTSTGFKIYNGGSSEIVFVGNRWISPSTGGNRGYIFGCNHGVTSGGNNSFLRDTVVYFAIAYDLCDQNADYVVARAENTISPSSNIMGHTNTGTGAWIHGTGAAGPTNQASIQASSVPGISESGFVVTVNLGVTSLPPAFGTPGNSNLPAVNISNVPISQYNGLFLMTALGPCATCGSGGVTLTANQLQYNLCNVFGTCTTGLPSSGQGTTTVSNTSQQNTVTGAMVNFDYGLIIGPEAESTFCGALNLGPSNRNQFLDEGTDTECITNQGYQLQAQSTGVPGLRLSPGLAAGTMTTDLAQAWTGPGETGTLFWHLDGIDSTSAGQGIAAAPSVQATLYANGSLVNDGAIGTFTNSLVSFSIGQQATLAPASTPGGSIVGICTALCGTSGNPVIAGANSLTSLIADGAVLIGDYLAASSSQDGAGTDVGATAPGTPVIRALSNGFMGVPPTLNGFSTPAGSSGFTSGTLYASATCVNPLGGETQMQATDLAVTVNNTVTLVINHPTCNPQDIGWFAQATHPGQLSGQETRQVATTPECHTVIVHQSGADIFACSLTSNWGSGAVSAGSTPPASNTDGPLVNVFVTLP